MILLKVADWRSYWALAHLWIDVWCDADEDGGSPTGHFSVVAGSPGEHEGSRKMEAEVQAVTAFSKCLWCMQSSDSNSSHEACARFIEESHGAVHYLKILGCDLCGGSHRLSLLRISVPLWCIPSELDLRCRGPSSFSSCNSCTFFLLVLSNVTWWNMWPALSPFSGDS